MSDIPALLKWMSEKLDVDVRPQPLNQVEQCEWRAYRVDLSRFRLRLSEHTPCIEVPHDALSRWTPAQLKRLLNDLTLAQGWQRRNTLVLVDGEADELKVLCRSEILPPLILDHAAQERILSGGANSNVLIEEISKQAPISALAPYETSAPVTGEQFFGREADLRHILQNPTASFLVVGNRRMGKTSLLREALRRMARESKSGGDAHKYFDCSVFRTRQEFYAELVRELDGPREIERIYRDNTFSIQSFIQRMARARREKIVLFLDEIDTLLDWDARDNWTVISMLRAVTAAVHNPAHAHIHAHHPSSFVPSARSGQAPRRVGAERPLQRDRLQTARNAQALRASSDSSDERDDRDRQPLRVVMAGFRLAQTLAERVDTPLFNFASTLSLTNFDHRVTEQIVLEPMLNLGLRIVDRNSLVNRIYRETAGQPNLIQHYCTFIIRQLEADGSREVTTALLDRALTDDTIRRRATSELIANASNLEQLIVFSFTQQLWSKGAGDKFTLADADNWLQGRGVQLPRSDLEQALGALETSGLLTREGKLYGFAFGALPRALMENYDLHYQIRKIIEEGV